MSLFICLSGTPWSTEYLLKTASQNWVLVSDRNPYFAANGPREDRVKPQERKQTLFFIKLAV